MHELVLALGVHSGYICKTPWNPGRFLRDVVPRNNLLVNFMRPQDIKFKGIIRKVKHETQQPTLQNDSVIFITL